MKRFVAGLLSFVLTLAALVGPVAGAEAALAAPAGELPYAPGEVVVQLRSGAQLADGAGLLRDYGLQAHPANPGSPLLRLIVPPGDEKEWATRPAGRPPRRLCVPELL